MLRALRAAAGLAIALVAGASPAFADQPAFRLGDAAAPFGWSTVVADFDTDGHADVAVADHAAGGRGERYRLEVSVAGQVPRDFIFESSGGAVMLRVTDVDRDNDLDVVAATPL